ncbi:MAG TPA: helix-turn-helix domain-containing protein, partial [Micromonospora sp.]
MFTIGVSAEGLLRSRFALSRLAELTNGLEVLTHPERAPYASRGVAVTRPRVDAAGLTVLLELVDRATWYVPDFLVPVPDRYSPSLAQELDGVIGTPAEVVRHQLRLAFRIGAPPPGIPAGHAAGTGHDPRPPLPPAVADVLAAGESALLACLAEQLDRCWRLVAAASWPALHRVLDSDVRHRTAVAGQVGFGRVVAEIDDRLDWDGRRLALPVALDAGIEAPTGLVFVPSVFLHRPALWWFGAGLPTGDPGDGRGDGQTMVGYRARGRGQVWAVPEGPAAVGELLGDRRAQLLRDLEPPRSTTELASRHRLSPATVSYHLTRLLRAGLVERQQDGHSVLYRRTGRAAALLAVIGDPRTDDSATDDDPPRP